MEKAIDYMYGLMSKKIKYSMTGSRTGKDGTGDCSGTLYQGLLNAGLPSAGWVLNTDSFHAWLTKNGYKLIAANKTWNMQRGDIIIFGKKGASGGAAGHIVIAVDGTNVIHCNYNANGVSVNNENTLPYNMGWYVYRRTETKPSVNLTQVAKDVIAGKYGNGNARKIALSKAGFNPSAVQKEVNVLLLGKGSKDLTQVARDVIAGKYGNGTARVQALKKAGFNPAEVQKKVNGLL